MKPIPASTPPRLYRIEDDGKAITCLICQRTSWHPKDVEQSYCGRCHLFLDDVLEMFVICFNPIDHPNCFTVRRHLISTGRLVPDKLLGAPSTLEAARALLPPGLTRLDRAPNDDPVIMESYL